MEMSVNEVSNAVNEVSNAVNEVSNVVNEQEKEVDDVTVVKAVDLRDAQYYAFVVPASQKKQDGFVECIIAGEDEVMPFLAKPLTKKPTYDQIRDYVGGYLTTVVPSAMLKKHGYNVVYADDEGLLKPSPVYNADASAFVVSGFGSLCGDVVFCREGKRVAARKGGKGGKGEKDVVKKDVHGTGRAGAAKKKPAKK